MEAASLRDARLAWMASQYHRYAVHSPNEMPEQPGFEAPEGVTRQVDLVEAKAWMRAISKGAENGS